MIWVAVFPTLTVLNLALGGWLGTLTPVLRTFVLATVAVPIVIYGLMTQLHKVRARLRAPHGPLTTRTAPAPARPLGRPSRLAAASGRIDRGLEDTYPRAPTTPTERLVGAASGSGPGPLTPRSAAGRPLRTTRSRSPSGAFARLSLVPRQSSTGTSADRTYPTHDQR
jgi:hypothetical protein